MVPRQAFRQLNRHQRTRWHGFTLFELLLVLTILAILASTAIPAVENIMGRQRLRGAADEIRLAWDGARLKAMRTGQAQIFECQTDSNTYTIEPLILHDDQNNIGTGGTLMVGGVAVQADNSNSGMTTSVANTSSSSAKNIDESLKFASCVVGSDMRAYAMAQSGESGQVTLQTINQSVIFYPDGSSSTAEIRIQNERGDSVGVQVRGLTGQTKLIPLVAGNAGAQS